MRTNATFQNPRLGPNFLVIQLHHLKPQPLRPGDVDDCVRHIRRAGPAAQVAIPTDLNRNGRTPDVND